MRDAVRGKMKSGHEVTTAEAGLWAWKGVTTVFYSGSSLYGNFICNSKLLT